MHGPPPLSAEQIRYVARHSAATTVVLHGAEELSRWKPVLGDLPAVRHIVILDEDVLPNWASASGLGDTDPRTLASHPVVRAEIDQAVQAASARVEQIKRYQILPRTWTPESGEVTPTLKLRRRVINERHATAIDALHTADQPLKDDAVINLHHAHLMASDIDATIAFWREGFGAEIVYDMEFAGARNVFMAVGTGRIHLYDQPPKTTERSTVHHLGLQTDEIETVVERLRGMGVSVTDIRREPTAVYAMAEGPDRLLLEIFQPDPTDMPAELASYFGFTS